MACTTQDAAFCAKVHGKLNKVSTASAAAAESLDDNHLRLMLVNGRIIRWELASLWSAQKLLALLVNLGSVVFCRKSDHLTLEKTV